MVGLKPELEVGYFLFELSEWHQIFDKEEFWILRSWCKYCNLIFTAVRMGPCANRRSKLIDNIYRLYSLELIKFVISYIIT